MALRCGITVAHVSRSTLHRRCHCSMPATTAAAIAISWAKAQSFIGDYLRSILSSGDDSALPPERGRVIFSSMRKLQAIFSSYDASCKFLTIIRENEASLFHRHLLRIRWVSWCRLDIQHCGTRTRRRNEDQACMDADIQRPPDDTLPDLVVDLRRVFLGFGVAACCLRVFFWLCCVVGLFSLWSLCF